MGGPSAEDEMAIALAMSMEDQGGAGAAALVSSAPPPAVRVAQVAAVDPGVVADEGIVLGLESMGFSREHATAAARATFNVSTEEAMEWCLSNPCPTEEEQTAPAPAVSMPPGATPFVDDLVPAVTTPAPAPAPAVPTAQDYLSQLKQQQDAALLMQSNPR